MIYYILYKIYYRFQIFDYILYIIFYIVYPIFCIYLILYNIYPIFISNVIDYIFHMIYYIIYIIYYILFIKYYILTVVPPYRETIFWPSRRPQKMDPFRMRALGTHITAFRATCTRYFNNFMAHYLKKTACSFCCHPIMRFNF